MLIIMNVYKKIAEYTVTVSYIGKINLAPGTFGSIVAFPLYYITSYYITSYQITFPNYIYDFIQNERIHLFLIELSVTIVVFVIGLYAINIYIKDMVEQDPREVVIDEVTGQMLTITLVFGTYIYHCGLQHYICIFGTQTLDNIIWFILLPFILFRLFDITKPWPINWLDQHITGAWGIMIDDIVAALYAVILQYLLLCFIM